jgi:hypothetical protein
VSCVKAFRYTVLLLILYGPPKCVDSGRATQASPGPLHICRYVCRQETVNETRRRGARSGVQSRYTCSRSVRRRAAGGLWAGQLRVTDQGDVKTPSFMGRCQIVAICMCTYGTLDCNFCDKSCELKRRDRWSCVQVPAKFLKLHGSLQNE